MFPGWLEQERKTAVEQKVEKVEPFSTHPGIYLHEVEKMYEKVMLLNIDYSENVSPIAVPFFGAFQAGTECSADVIR